MPIFEYICKKCGAEFEKLVVNSAEKVNCEKCSSKNVEKKLSLFSASVASPQSSCPVGSSCPSAAAGGCPGSSCCGMPGAMGR